MSRDHIPDVRILTSPAEVAAARAQGDAYATELSATLDPDGLDQLTRVTHIELFRFAQERARILPLLRDLAWGSDARAAGACVALTWFGEPRYLGRLRELLAAATPPVLGKYLDSIARSEPVLRELRGIEAIAPPILEIAQRRDDPDRLAATRAAFAIGVTVGGPELVDELVQIAGATTAKYPDQWIGQALGLLARRGGDAGSRAARALLQPPFGFSARRARQSRDPHLVDDLERLLRSGITKDLQGEVLQALADVLRRGAVPMLLEALNDPELAPGAAKGLGIAGHDSGDESIVAALTLAAAGIRNGGFHAREMARNAGLLAMAMACIGGPLAVRTLAGLVKRVDLFAATYVAWRTRGITGTGAIQRFADAGVIPRMPTEAEIRAAAESDSVFEANDVWLWWEFLRRSHRLLVLWPEDHGSTDGVPRHTLMLEQFAGATGGRVVVEHASQVASPKNSEEHEVLVQFVWGDRVYQVTAIAYQRCFNVAALGVLLNEALRDRGESARFVRLSGHDRPQFIFGDERAVVSACDELMIFRGDDSRRASFEAWTDTLVTAAPRADGVAMFPAGGIGFHIISPTNTGRAYPRQAVDDAVSRALGSSAGVEIQAAAGWTALFVRIPREVFAVRGAEAVASLFESLCETVEAHLARTVSGGDWARVEDGELAGGIDALDWLQYFGPRFGDWLGKYRSNLLSARATPRGAQLVTLPLDPLAPSWVAIEKAGFGLRLRPFPDVAQAEVDPDVRLRAALPPEPARWTPEQRAEMLESRGRTWTAIETGMADAELFDRFSRRYLPGELDATLLDRVATWLPHYGADATTAAFRAVARRHDAQPAAGPFDEVALEGCVKLVSWAGERPLIQRELLAEHTIDLNEPYLAVFARDAYDPDLIRGMINLTAEGVRMCDCERCRQIKAQLG